MFRTGFAAMAIALTGAAAGVPVWQPIIDYTISFPGDRPDAAPLINPFENFTHLASDFGWMGPGEGRIDAKNGIIRVKRDGEWTGAWHSLAGLARQSERTLDPADLVGLGGDPAKMSAARELALNASGHGLFRLELVDVHHKIIWQRSMTLNSDHTVTHRFPIAPEVPGRIKFMNWVAEKNCEVQISSIGFIAERPEMPLEEWAFRISLGKLRRCHDAASGLTRDRGHLPAGKFESISSTGMHALASALGAAEGLLDRERVVAEIDRTLGTLEGIDTASGFFPHFIQRGTDGKNVIVPGTEYSTVDTSIALHALLLATRVLGLEDRQQRVVAMIGRIDFDAVTDQEGWISHGFYEDGKTRLPAMWRDWGGETALVLALESMIPERKPCGKMLSSGEPYRGVGFIAEIQSLFYPDFDQPAPDRVSRISWPKVRRGLLMQQIAYPNRHWPESAAARFGIFGLSAGESGMPGAGYTANGVEVMGVRWIHPHYMLMGLALSGDDLYAKGLKDLDSREFLYPFGLPENIEVELQLQNPMQGSLNASFEALAAYHGWKKRKSAANVLDRVAIEEPLLRKAAARFYAP